MPQRVIIDDRDARIVYNSTTSQDGASPEYRQTVTSLPDVGSAFSFKFYGQSYSVFDLEASDDL